MTYVELHAHSAFSFLDGASGPDELAAAAAEHGYAAMALTDHNGVSGSMEFAQAAGGLGLRALHGAEVDLDDGRPLSVGGRTVESVRESWLIEDRWWTDAPLRRRYWEVVTTHGDLVVLFRELDQAGGWYRQR